jgi:hypothetical protein
MFTEFEIDSMLEITEIKEATFQLKKDFIRNEAPYLELSDHDFFSLVMMAPTVGVALASGSISLFEEMAINKKARKLSKGGYFMKKDPVVHAMKFLIKKFDNWSDKFYGLLKLTIQKSFDAKRTERVMLAEDIASNFTEYKKLVLAHPFILIRFISSFFLENDDDIISDERQIATTEFRVMQEIGEKVGLHEFTVFQMFCGTFKVKS